MLAIVLRIYKWAAGATRTDQPEIYSGVIQPLRRFRIRWTTVASIDKNVAFDVGDPYTGTLDCHVTESELCGLTSESILSCFDYPDN